MDRSTITNQSRLFGFELQSVSAIEMFYFLFYVIELDG